MKNTKGIILAGGVGSRLYPLSAVYSKQLVAVYDKPMIYYPFSHLVSVGIREILIISDKHTLLFYKKLFGDGNSLGLEIEYVEQVAPNGIAEAFILGEDFIKNNNVVLILGDNIFYGEFDIFSSAIKNNTVATIFGIYVNEPERYGVIKYTNTGMPEEIVEKPKIKISNYAVPGFYIYDSSIVEVAKNLVPSERGELEITDINNFYLRKKQLKVIKMQRGYSWLDSGTPESLLNASNLIASLQQRLGVIIGSPEEAALNSGFITCKELKKYIQKLPICNYKTYLETLCL